MYRQITDPPIHPGEILLEEFIKPYKLNPYCVAVETNLSPPYLESVIESQRSITPYAANQLANLFGNSQEFWLGLQKQYDTNWAEYVKQNNE